MLAFAAAVVAARRVRCRTRVCRSPTGQAWWDELLGSPALRRFL